MLLHHLPALAERKIILASASPRRKELLGNLGLKFEVRLCWRQLATMQRASYLSDACQWLGPVASTRLPLSRSDASWHPAGIPGPGQHRALYPRSAPLSPPPHRQTQPEPHAQIVVSDFDEMLPKGRFQHPVEYAVETARQKAMDVAAKTLADQVRTDLIIGADTIVEYQGQILEKPADAADAFRVLSMWVWAHRRRRRRRWWRPDGCRTQLRRPRLGPGSCAALDAPAAPPPFARRLSGGKHQVHTGVALVLPMVPGGACRRLAAGARSTAQRRKLHGCVPGSSPGSSACNSPAPAPAPPRRPRVGRRALRAHLCLHHRCLL
jgi:hypothetical protein